MSTTLISSDQNHGIINTITAFGDSLTAGTGGTPITDLLGYAYPNRLIQNQGIGGQTMQQIAARQGALPVFVTLSGNAFSGNTAVSATVTTQLLSTAADTTIRQVSGTVLGIQCVLSRTVVSGTETYTLQPVGPSSAPIPANTQFFPDSAYNARGHVQLLWWGRNNVPSLTGLDTLVDTAIAYLRSPRRFLVQGVVNAQNEPKGSGNYTAIQAMNAKLITAWADRYVSVEPPTVAEMTALNYAPTSQDLIDIGNGIMPGSFVVDNVHRTTLGYQFHANRIAAKLSDLGW